MGSSGTGRISDYSGHENGNSDKCANDINTYLEEIERCEYYKNHSALPENNGKISLVIKDRITVILNGEELGYLPTQYNYIATCQDYNYSGKIISTIDKPFIKIIVKIIPTKQ